MRDIKFRAWNKKKKVMCYANEDNTADYWDGVRLSIIEFINFQLSTNPYNEGLDRFSFRTNYEIMQYTGLKDKNGKEIYEGDILHPGYIVAYVDGSKGEDLGMNIGFYIQRDDFESWSMLEVGEEYEIIGNIYESEDKQ